MYEDPLWRAFDEQYREAEVEQAIDRARLVWSGEEKEVYVLTSLVGRFEVDSLATLDELAGWSKFERAHELLGPVVPLGIGWLTQNLSEIFGRESAAKEAVRQETARLRSETRGRISVYRSIPKSDPLTHATVPLLGSNAVIVSYRVAGQSGSPTKAHVLQGTELHVVRAELERLHGKAVRLEFGENVTVLKSVSVERPNSSLQSGQAA